jgi:hypothetical protein
MEQPGPEPDSPERFLQNRFLDGNPLSLSETQIEAPIATVESLHA